MRRLIVRPLVLVLTFLFGLFVTLLITFAGDAAAWLLDEPSDTIPALSMQAATPVDEEAAIYAAVIEPASLYENASLVVIQDQTVTGAPLIDETAEDEQLNSVFADLQREFPASQRETLDSFRANNQLPHPMTDHPFLRRIKSRLIGPPDFSNTSYQAWWEAFHATYHGANGFYVLSKVGFNREMNQALVYRAYACNDTCGYGSYLLLVKEHGIWTIKGSAGQWVS